MTAIYYPFLRAKTFDVIAVSNLAQLLATNGNGVTRSWGGVTRAVDPEVG